MALVNLTETCCQIVEPPFTKWSSIELGKIAISVDYDRSSDILEQNALEPPTPILLLHIMIVKSRKDKDQ